MLAITQLGKTDMQITRLGYGAMEIRALIGEDPGPTSQQHGRLRSEEEAGEVLNAVLDSGINYIDTAWCYGRSEEFIGRYISHRRNEFYLATKCGHFYHNYHSRTGWSEDALIRCLDESLSRLKTDYVDLLQLHNPTLEEFRLHNCGETLMSFKEQGKIRYIGISTTLPGLDEFLSMGLFDVFQVPYSLVAQEHHEAIQYVRKQGLGTVIRGGVGEGTPVAGIPSRKRYSQFKQRWQELELDEILHEMDPMELALRFTLSNPNIDSVIVGTRSVEHVVANVTAAEKGPLPENLLSQLKQRIANINS